jgi:hypothetical protein
MEWKDLGQEWGLPHKATIFQENLYECFTYPLDWLLLTSLAKFSMLAVTCPPGYLLSYATGMGGVNEGSQASRRARHWRTIVEDRDKSALYRGTKASS